MDSRAGGEAALGALGINAPIQPQIRCPDTAHSRTMMMLWLLRNKPEGLWLTLDQFDRSAQVLDQWRAQTQPTYTWG